MPRGRKPNLNVESLMDIAKQRNSNVTRSALNMRLIRLKPENFSSYDQIVNYLTSPLMRIRRSPSVKRKKVATGARVGAELYWEMTPKQQATIDAFDREGATYSIIANAFHGYPGYQDVVRKQNPYN